MNFIKCPLPSNLLHLQGLGRLIIVNPAAIEQEAKTGHWNSHLKQKTMAKTTVLSSTHPLAVALLQFAHLGSLLHSEVDLVGVLAHNLQLDVLSLIGHPVGLVSSDISETNLISTTRTLSFNP